MHDLENSQEYEKHHEIRSEILKVKFILLNKL